MSDLSREFSVAGASVGHDQLAVRSTSVPVAGEDSAQAPRRAPLVMMALALIGLAVAPYDPYAIYNGQLSRHHRGHQSRHRRRPPHSGHANARYRADA